MKNFNYPSRAGSIQDVFPSSGKVIGFFPGLGSRALYQNLGRSLLDSGIPQVADVYQDAARALGFPGRPEKLLMVPENLPTGKMEQRGFVGAAFLVHNLALEAYLRAAADRAGAPLHFVAYTGESFGVLASAVASGSVSVGDGVKIAQAFTPLMMTAAEGDGGNEPFARRIASCLPASRAGRPLVPEPFHVVALKGAPEDLAEVLREIDAAYPRTDVELHKLYSRRQRNIYVRTGVKPDFDMFMKKFPAVTAEELKAPTTFLAHSARMREVRHALERFIEENGIVFQDPRTPVISNHSAGLLTTAADVRDGILSITDEVMDSQATAETLNGLDPDMVLELGLGNKSVRLLADNNVQAPVTTYTGTVEETDLLISAVKLVDGLVAELKRLRSSGDRLAARNYDTLRDLFRLAARSPFCDRYLCRTASRVIVNEMLHSERNGSPAFYRLLEIFQHTYDHRDIIDVDRGELVLRARLKKRIAGPADELGRVHAELRVIDETAVVTDRGPIEVERPEVGVFHFGRPAGLRHADLARKTRLLLDTQPSARRIYGQVLETLGGDGLPVRAGTGVPTADQLAMSHFVYQYALFHILQVHRPALFAQTDHYIAGSDPAGWLVALAASEALPFPRAVEFYGEYRRNGLAAAALDRMSGALKDSDVPVVSPDGIPLRSRKDLAAATRAVFRDGALDAEVRRVHLNGRCQIISLGSPLDPARMDAGTYEADVISVPSPADIGERGVNPALDGVEDRCVWALTAENEKVLRYARDRRLLSSMVNAYVGIDEAIVGFGKGGSESMTIFLKKDGEDGITVRKILSEALTTAHWNPKGQGVMLPPFAKAKKQAEYLRALPESVRPYFPKVHDLLERDVPIPAHLRADGKAAHREVIYEMDYVAGEEVSRFVERHSPPPAVVARLYEQIFRVLNQHVHSVNRVPAPGETLDVSYFTKIEDRLALCRRTAPRTFCPELLDTERIIINGVSYLNSSVLLKRFREHPEYLEVLEPPFHSLVMGDTNTENIKIADCGPLLSAQRLIEAGAPREQIDAALAAITPDSLGITFLDPRAIGFKSDGGETRDDPMYDNKPWHNSIGHYDEIHYERFTLRVETGEGRTPRVDIEFAEGNPYQKAYRVRDVAAKDGKVHTAAEAQGMEDYFGPMMTAIYDLGEGDYQDPYWVIRFVFIMGTHFTAMPPYHFQAELDGRLTDTYQAQRRPVAIYCEGIKWLNWALEMLEGRRTEFLGVPVPALPYVEDAERAAVSSFEDAMTGDPSPARGTGSLALSPATH
jgi:malonyl CoA-acyl carrier protein transacylase